MKSQLQALLAETLARLAVGELAGVQLPAEIPVERTRDSAHGDFASNIALGLAKSSGRKPVELAKLIQRALPASALIREVKIAGPGFINFFLTPAAQFAVLAQILDLGAVYGRAPANSRDSILIEFVSANPTGPLHVGHGRGAAYGDSLANLLEAAGHKVTREYYVNDAGRQVDVLAVSVWLQYLELFGEVVPFPNRGYPADYVRVIAEQLKSQQRDSFRRVAGEVAQNLPA
ncbi:MAG: arginine--tRNA ligase, partial [Nevskiales bacterium]